MTKADRTAGFASRGGAKAFPAPVSHKSEVIVLLRRGKVVAIFFRYT